MKRLLSAVALSVGVAASPLSAQARDISVTVTNLSNANYFTPLLVAAHSRHVDFFNLAEMASEHLQAMAEGGDTTGLVDDVVAAGGVFDANPAGGPLAPGASATANLSVHGRSNPRLSVVAMVLPTNDAFIGLDSVRIPKRRGTYTFFLRSYDAGTEANDEIINGGGGLGEPGIPADPGLNGGMGATGVAGPDQNPTVHVHRGVLGDMDLMGGVSDLDRSVHRWQDPIARIVLRVGHHHH